MREIVLDTETTGLDPFCDRLVGISLSPSEGEAYYLPVGHRGEKNLPIEAVREHLGPLLADAGIEKWGHHLKFDGAFLEQAELPLSGIAFDTLIASQLVRPELLSHGLDALAHLNLEILHPLPVRKPVDVQQLFAGQKLLDQRRQPLGPGVLQEDRANLHLVRRRRAIQ